MFANHTLRATFLRMSPSLHISNTALQIEYVGPCMVWLWENLKLWNQWAKFCVLGDDLCTHRVFQRRKSFLSISDLILQDLRGRNQKMLNQSFLISCKLADFLCYWIRITPPLLIRGKYRRYEDLSFWTCPPQYYAHSLVNKGYLWPYHVYKEYKNPK